MFYFTIMFFRALLGACTPPIEANNCFFRNVPLDSNYQPNVPETQVILQLGDLHMKVVSLGDIHPGNISDNPPSELIVIGPGDLEHPENYRDFAKHIHLHIGLPVWIAGLDDEKQISAHCLDDHIRARQRLFLDYFEHVRVICVDHSSACYVTMNLLNCPEISSIIAHCYMIQPLVHKPSTIFGHFLQYATEKSRQSFFIWLSSTVYSILPSFMQTGFLNWFPKRENDNNNGKELARHLMMRHAKMYEDLFDKDREDGIPVDFLCDNTAKLHILVTDGDIYRARWWYTLTDFVPEIDIKVKCSIAYPHTFYDNEWGNMGKCIVKWIQQRARPTSIGGHIKNLYL